MEKKSLLKLLDIMESSKESAIKTKDILLNHNPNSNVKRLLYHIEMCERSINQINKKLLNSNFQIDSEILEYILDKLEMEAYLDKALNIRDRI